MRSLFRILTATTAVTLSAGLLVACGATDDSGGSQADGGGEGPQSVVLTSYAAAATLDELDLEDRVKGITKGAAMPDVLETYRSDDYVDIGTLQEPDMTKVAEIGPDLLVWGARSQEMVPEFERVTDTVMAGDADTSAHFTSNRERVMELAGQFGPDAEQQAEEKLAELDGKVEETKAAAEDAGTALVIMTSGGRASVYGAGSRFGIIFDDLGLTPAGDIPTEGRHGAPMSWEEIAELDPDHVFVIDRDATIGREGEAAEQLLDNAVFERTTAAREDNVHMLDGQSWYLVGSGLGVLDSMVEEIHEAIS